MPKDSSQNKGFKATAVLLALKPGVVDCVRRTGQLPKNWKTLTGGFHIGVRFVYEKRGLDITLGADEQLVCDALARNSEETDGALAKKGHASATVPADPSPRDLIYGETAFRSLVFVERSKALENIAFRAATTWGELRQSAPTLYERAISGLGTDEDDVPDDRELDHDALDGDGDFLHFPAQLMLDFIPDELRVRFGTVEEAVFNGPMLRLDPSHEAEIVAELRGRRFSVERNDALIDALYA